MDHRNVNTSRYSLDNQIATKQTFELHTATDHHLNRTVVRKGINFGRALEPVRRQLRFEGEILARLDHPNILPIYDMAFPEDDLHGARTFLILRYVQGEDFGEIIEKLYRRPRDGEFKDRLRFILEQFARACDAISFANRQRILHCDVKPANIMLDRSAEPIVIDWGHALAIPGGDDEASAGDEAAATDNVESAPAEARIRGSLGFQSPELASCERDIDRRSDVYSLGATLYQILTGQAPEESTIARLRDWISSPKHTSDAQWRDAPKDLLAVSVKAMEPKRDKRYDDASEIADEIRRHHRDEVTRARRRYDDSLLHHLLAANRRYKRVVIAAGAAALVLAAISFYQSHLKNQAQAARDEARASRDQASHLFKVAVDSVNVLNVEASEALQWYPGSLQVRSQLLAQAAEAFGQLSTYETNDYLLKVQRIRTRLLLANVKREQGGPNDFAEACDQYRHVLNEIDQHLADGGQKVPLIVEKGNAHFGLAVSLLSLKQLEGWSAADARHDEIYQHIQDGIGHLSLPHRSADSKAFYDALTFSDPELSLSDAEMLRCDSESRLASGLNVGHALMKFSTLDQYHAPESDLALSSLQEALRILRTIDDEDRQEVILATVRVRSMLANRWLSAGRTDDAAAELKKVVDRLEPMADDELVDPDVMWELGVAQSSLGELHWMRGEYPDAKRSYEGARASFAILEQLIPERDDFPFNRSLALMNLGSIAIAQCDTELAKKSLQTAREILNVLANWSTSHVGYVKELARCNDLLAQVHASVDQDLVQAIELFGNSIAAYQRVANHDESVIEDLALAESHYAQALGNSSRRSRLTPELAKQRLELSITRFDEAIANLNLVLQSGDNPRTVNRLARVLFEYGDVLHQADHLDKAEQLFDQASELWERLAQRDQPVSEHMIDYANFLTTQPDATLDDANMAVQLLEQTRESISRISFAFNASLALALSQAGRDDEAQRVLEQIENGPERSAIIAQFVQANLERKVGESERAAETLREAVKRMDRKVPFDSALLRLRRLAQKGSLGE